MPAPRRNSRVDRFHHERRLRLDGAAWIAGIDEAGRGPLAGPVVAAAVILPPAWIEEGMPGELRELTDSKQLTETQREEFFGLLTSNADVVIGLAECDAELIDRINILQATHLAMQRALAALTRAPDHLLVDGRPVPPLPVGQTALVQGDSLSYSIAAASVIAKVTRDRQMQEWDRRHPEYGFAEHKGYGTPQHLAALATHGPCPIHRRSFAPLKPVQGELFR
ncbi:MAG TPA: ribonuclease HII [Verrucomicrobiales bacterium]|nr:ribonuclease HII [Verrucomicrobiales bacterium]